MLTATIPPTSPPAGRVAAFWRLHRAYQDGDQRAVARFRRELRSLGVSACRTTTSGTPPTDSPGPVTHFARLVQALEALDFKEARSQLRLLRAHGYAVVLFDLVVAPRAPQVTHHQATKRERRTRPGPPFPNSLARSPGEFQPAGGPGTTP